MREQDGRIFVVYSVKVSWIASKRNFLLHPDKVQQRGTASVCIIIMDTVVLSVIGNERAGFFLTV
jgi:hypothetical protein